MPRSPGRAGCPSCCARRALLVDSRPEGPDGRSHSTTGRVRGADNHSPRRWNPDHKRTTRLRHHTAQSSRDTDDTAGPGQRRERHFAASRLTGAQAEALDAGLDWSLPMWAAVRVLEECQRGSGVGDAAAGGADPVGIGRLLSFRDQVLLKPVGDEAVVPPGWCTTAVSRSEGSRAARLASPWLVLASSQPPWRT